MSEYNLKMAYSVSSQSNLAGQSKRPVRGWLKPRVILEFRGKGGTTASSAGAIQSMMIGFKYFVSSPLAAAAPLPT